MILGTAAYMSPEQATRHGRSTSAPTSGRSACVLYEMLTGQRLFGGETIAHTLADVLRAPIDSACVESARADHDAARALPGSRRQDTPARHRRGAGGDCDVSRGPGERTEVPRVEVRPSVGWPGPRRRSSRCSRSSDGCARGRRRAVPRRTWRLRSRPRQEASRPWATSMQPPQISPDGTAVIFYGTSQWAGSGGGVQLRRLNTLTPEPVRTGGFRNPGFWSPDSRSFVFTDGTNLKKMRVPDGAPEIVANDVAALVGGSWSDNGTLLVSRSTASRSVRRSGGRRSRQTQSK